MAPVKNIFLTGQPGVGKTTLLIKVVDMLKATGVPMSGFYTQERRSGGDRSGFDIVTVPEGKVGPLAREGSASKGAPAVGKYVVDVPSIEALAVSSLAVHPSPGLKLLICDEIGKMELKSAKFLPAVTRALDAPGVIVFGTVPVPRYGHTIAEVEGVKGRADTAIIKVTKDTRDALVSQVHAVLATLLRGEQPASFPSRVSAGDGAGPSTAAGPAANDPSKRRKTEPSLVPSSTSKNPLVLAEMPPPAPPLVSATVPPRVLLLGESASPSIQGREDYSERSLWSVLDRVTGAAPSAPYAERVKAALDRGIAIWDVSREVHLPKDVTVTGVEGGAGARKKKGSGGAAAAAPMNDLAAFLAANPSVKAVAFNGTAAAQLARKHFAAALGQVEVFTLPSSSRAATGMTAEEKVKWWRDALLK